MCWGMLELGNFLVLLSRVTLDFRRDPSASAP